MQKTVLIAVVVLVAILIGGYILWKSSANNVPLNDNFYQTENPATSTEPSNSGANSSPEPASGTSATDNNSTVINSFMVQDMKVEVLKEGAGKEAKTGDAVTVNYTGTLTDGTKFDSSLNPGRAPFQFTIGPNCKLNNTCVIEGWNLGVTGMKVGEKRKLTIPSDLGYGAAGTPGGPIPPNATLIFEVELLGINQ